MVSICAKVTGSIIIVILLLIGIFFLTAFPLALFPTLVKSQLKLSTNGDGQPSTITWYWSHLPANSYYNYYMFNVTNVDSAWFFGEKTSVNDVGPYAYREWESKTFTISDDKESAFFVNDKAWAFDKNASCSNCFKEDFIWIPNLSLMATSELMAQAGGLSSGQKLITNLGTLLLGAYPFVRVSVQDALFDGYNDPLLNLINSPLVAILQKMNISLFGFDVPDIQDIGFFAKYNHTADMNYTVNTGKSDYKKVGAIQTWAGSSNLSWWSSAVANDVTGGSDGAYWGGFLKKTDVLKNFQTFTCRHLDMVYSYSTHVDGISTWAFAFPEDTFDTTVDKNTGYTVVNYLNKTFFPNWASKNGLNKFENSPFPPGLIEQKCFPGRNKPIPFMATLSLPHFYGADPEVIQNVNGLRPRQEKHNMGIFKIQPTVGSTVQANLRIQFSVAMFQDNDILSMRSLKNSIVPSFWMEVEIKLKDYAKNYVRFNTKTIPMIGLIVGIVSTALSALVIFIAIFCSCRNSRRKN